MVWGGCWVKGRLGCVGEGGVIAGDGEIFGGLGCEMWKTHKWLYILFLVVCVPMITLSVVYDLYRVIEKHGR